MSQNINLSIFFFLCLDILLSKGGEIMKLKGLAISMGLGIAVGAVAGAMLPKQSAAKKLVNKAAWKVEDAAMDIAEKVAEHL
jgi:hypothetical protein